MNNDVETILGYSPIKLRRILKKLDRDVNYNYDEITKWFLLNSPNPDNVTKVTMHTLIDNYRWYNKIELGEYKRVCDYCGKTFFTNAPRTIYCSSYCGVKQRDLNNKLRRVNKCFVERKCMFCNEIFKTNILNDEYCSHNCKIKMLNFKHKIGTDIDTILCKYVIETMKLIEDENQIIINMNKIKKCLLNKKRGKKIKHVKPKPCIKLKTKRVISSKPYTVDENKLLKDLFKFGSGASKAYRKEEIRRDVYKESFNSAVTGNESLFCDTDFLEKFFGKQIKKSDECE